MKLVIADHYGFCMGVRRALDRALKESESDSSLTIYREIVHNEKVIERLRDRGIGQCFDLSDIKEGSLMIPTHGAVPDIFRQAEKTGLNIVDLTCPLVLRVHRLVRRLADEGYRIIHFARPDHDETIAVVGQAPDCITVVQSPAEIDDLTSGGDNIALTAQTTASPAKFHEVEEAAKKKFARIEIYNTICNATERRQKAAAELAERCDLFFVVGSEKSANTGHLYEIARARCEKTFRINDPDEIDAEWFQDNAEKAEVVGLTAGASTPRETIEAVIHGINCIVSDELTVVYPKTERDTTSLYLDL